MKHNLIMPKQTGQGDAFYASIEICYNSYKRGEQWLKNKLFKEEIQRILPYLTKGARDQAYLVKQSELARYFGLLFRDFPGKKTKITNNGIRFYNAYLLNDIPAQLDIIMNSILKDSFGRNNSAIKASDSDIDPPKVFLRSINDLGFITRKGLAYLLYVTHDLKISYNDALTELRKTNNLDREIPIEVSNKYNDVKFTILLTELGITKLIDGDKYVLSDFTIRNFKKKISNLSIYNKEPEIVMTLNDDGVFDGDMKEDSGEIFQTRVMSSFVYDIKSDRFFKNNNRIPEPIKIQNNIKYKTNPRISKTALHLFDYKCSCAPEEHYTFDSKIGKPYMEAHHLIPISAQKDFSVNIDRVENILSLCPNCHSAIHLGDDSVRLNILKTLFDQRKESLRECGINISFGDLFNKYYK